MHRLVSLLGILLIVAAAGADELPMPRKVDGAVPPSAPTLSDQAPTDANRELAELRNEIAKLQAARDALRADRDASNQTSQNGDPSRAEEIRRLQQRLADAVKRWEASQKQQPKVDPPQPVKPPTVPQSPDKSSVTPPVVKTVDPPPYSMTDAPVDALALGPVLFQTGDYEGALTAYRLLNIDKLGATDRMTVLYMTAACLRKLGKTDEAATLFREVANSKGEATLVECAQWQLSAIRWRRDVEAKLEEMKQRRKAMEARP